MAAYVEPSARVPPLEASIYQHKQMPFTNTRVFRLPKVHIVQTETCFRQHGRLLRHRHMVSHPGLTIRQKAILLAAIPTMPTCHTWETSDQKMILYCMHLIICNFSGHIFYR